MALPGNVAYTKITGRFLKAVTDTLADPDNNPDAAPFVGLTITFTPSISPPRVKNTSATPPVTMVIDTISATTDSEGDIVSPSGTKGIWLVSSDDPDLNPYGWTYRVVISGAGFPTLDFSFVAVSGGEFDIATMTPAPSNPGAALLEWQAAVAQVNAGVAEAEAAADASEGFAQESKDARDTNVWRARIAGIHTETLESGRLSLGSNSYQFLGLLDGTRTDVGTAAFVTRSTSTSANLVQRTAHVEWTASSTGTNVAAGGSIPLGSLTNGGLILDAVVGCSGGVTADTQLAFGICATSTVATAMSGGNPAALTNWTGAGYDSADSTVQIYSSGGFPVGGSGIGPAPSTSADQLINLRLYLNYVTGLYEYQVSTTSPSGLIGGAGGTVSNFTPKDVPVSFFVRMSSGATSATPKVSLYRLNIGTGLGVAVFGA